MSFDPSAQETFGQPTPPKSGSRFWLYLGLGCGSVVLLCCGGGVIGTVLIGKNAVKTTTDRAEVQRAVGEIADFDVPPGFNPDTAVTISVPFTDQTVMTMVSYAPPDKQGMILLSGIGSIAAAADREQMRRNVEQQMNQQGMPSKSLEIDETRDLEVEIRGQPAKFRIHKAHDPQSKQNYVQFDGMFEGKQGPAVLIGQVKAENFSEDDAENLLRSIK